MITARKRYFVAFPLDNIATTCCQEQQKKISELKAGARLVVKRKLHLTLAYLGELERERRSQIFHLIRDELDSWSALELRFVSLTGFPNKRQAQLAIFKLAGKDLVTLKFRVKKLRQKLGKENVWYDKKSFLPHVTLARFPQKVNLSRVESVAKQAELLSFANPGLYMSQDSGAKSYRRVRLV